MYLQLKSGRYGGYNKLRTNPDYGFVSHDLIRYELAASKWSSKKGPSNQRAAIQRYLVAPGCILGSWLHCWWWVVAVVQARARCRSSIHGGQMIHPQFCNPHFVNYNRNLNKPAKLRDVNASHLKTLQTHSLIGVGAKRCYCV